MYAVFSNDGIVYLGDNRAMAMEVLESKNEALLLQVNTLAGLSKSFSNYKECLEVNDEVEEFSSAIEQVLEKLDNAGINSKNMEDFSKRIKDNTAGAIAEVKSLGISGMSVVGDGFIALGDLMKAAQAEEDKEKQKNEPSQ